jgi:hypothetical protein
MISYCNSLTALFVRKDVHLFLSTRGYALPGVIVVSAMISLLVLIIAQLHREVIFLARDTKDVLLERNKPTLLEELSPDSSECIPFTTPPITQLLCKATPRTFKTYPRVSTTEQRRFIDFDSLFIRPDKCHNTSPSTSPLHGRLPTSPLTCTVDQHASERVIIKESLRAKRFTLLPTKNRSAALLASLGDIQIETELVLSADSVVVAAGSIRIKGVSSSDGNLRRLTLIAHSGDVSVDQLSSSVFPLVFGRTTLTLPSVKLHPPYPMVLEKRQPYIGGVMLFPLGNER